MTNATIRLLRQVTVLLCCIVTAACAESGNTLVYSGLDVLQQENFASLGNGNVGLITNHTSIDRSGRSSIEILHAADKVRLAAVFSPEHGIAGKLDIAEISDSIESSTGIPIISLYGENRRPTATMLTDIDVLVFDIQDIGTRFYTYISTMGYAMQAAAEHDLRFVVLDRPNPINGIDIGGPMLDDGQQSFVGFHPLPVRHGMTVGELALLFRAELELDLDLHVVRMNNWHRTDFFDDTGLPWVNPSPNIRNLTEAILYPGIGLLETTNLSVGRGTATPFEMLGAPWLDGESLAHHLTNSGHDGVKIEPVTFTPAASKFANEICSGIRMTITDKANFEPLRLGFAIARWLVLEYPDQWDATAYMRLLGNVETLNDVLSSKPLAVILANMENGVADFRARREPFLLYD